MPGVHGLVEGDGGQGRGGRSGHDDVEEGDGLRRGHPLAGVLVGKDGEYSGVQEFVAVGVVVVPVGVDESVGSVFADAGDGFANFGDGGGEVGVDEDVAVGAGLQNHVAAYALQQQVDVVVEFDCLDLLIRGGGAALEHAIGDGW